MYRKLLFVGIIGFVAILLWSVAVPTEAQRQTPPATQPVGTSGRSAGNFDQEP
jgi:cytoskeletal protein RodZ